METELVRSQVAIFRGLGQTGRLRVFLDIARHGERSVGELAHGLDRSQPAISNYLRTLRDAGLVQCRVDGRHRYYHARLPKGLKRLVTRAIEEADHPD